MIRAPLRLLCAAVMVALFPLASMAQPPASPAARLGQRVVEIRLVREGQPVDDPTVLALVETRVGDPLSMAQVRASITHIFGLGRFQDVQVEALDAPGGVALRYNLIPLHSVERVDFKGDPRLALDEGLLRDTVTNRFGAAPPVGRAPEVARLLEQLYRDRGYLAAAVVPAATEKHDPDRMLLVFTIRPGRQAVIGNVRIEGDQPSSRDAFLQLVRAVPGQAYRPNVIHDELDAYARKLRRRSRYQAAASYTATPSADGSTVDLVIDLHTGPEVSIAFEGDPLPKDKLSELVPIAKEASVDEDLIEDSVQRIRSFLNQQGYWKAEATPTRRDEDGTLRIVFAVNRGRQYRIAEGGVEVVGNHALALDQLRPALLKLQANDVFVEANLSAAVSVIAGQYQRLGYAQAKVTAGVNEVPSVSPALGLVRPVITVVEGPLTVIGAVTFDGNEKVPADQLRAVVTSQTGEPYYEPRVVADHDAVVLEYRNRGFASANVVVVPTPNADGTRADLKFHVTEGTQTIVDHVLIVGNTRTDSRIIQRELLVQEGKPLGLEDLVESQRRLGALGLFRRIRVEEMSHGAAKSDVLVTVEEGASTTFSYGGGLEAAKRLRKDAEGQAVERLEFAPRGFFDVGRRNIGGKNRSADLFTRLGLRPRDPAEGTGKSSPFGFSEYRIAGTYREPRALGLNADLFLTAAAEQGVRSTFNFARKGINVEVARRLAPGVRASVRYAFGTTRTFDEKLSLEDQARIDRVFPKVRLSGFGSAITRDTRDDVLDPERGTFFSGEGTVAARALGGQVGFLKTYAQGFWFRRLPTHRRTVFASRLAIGLADAFPRVVESIGAGGQPIPVTVEDLPASERFFAGGDTTIRGFPLDSVGAPNTITPSGFPRGGNALLLMNGELRLSVWRDFGAAFFLDGGNVYDRVAEVDLGELRGSAGFGLRYKSPIGPIRFDIGFKIDRRVNEPPRAFHLSIGQAF
jgi:outer membrane protein insertion porin family